jgi:phosphocarrier protein
VFFLRDSPILLKVLLRPEFIGQAALGRLFIIREAMSAKKLAADDNPMTKEFLVLNKLGIHARPAALFVKTANRFSCDIFVEKDGEKINGKSIMGLMMLAAGPGSKLTIHAVGADASKAIAEIESLMKRKFDEE